MHDVIIVGGGPAGLAAALDARYLRLKTLVFEADRAGGALSQSYPWKVVDSYLGFHERKGQEISDVIVGHARKSGAEIRENEAVEEISSGKGSFTVKTAKGRYEARTVIIATGIRGTPVKLGVPGEELEGISYSLSEPKKMKGKNVLVVGGGDSAADIALALENAGAKVWMAHRKDQLRATDENMEKIDGSSVKMLWRHEIERFGGKGKLDKAFLFNNKTDEKSSLSIDAAVICIGSVASDRCMQGLGLKMDGPCVKVDENGMTSVEGLFAAGDIVSKLKRIPQALASGEKAAYSAYKMIKNPYWK